MNRGLNSQRYAEQPQANLLRVGRKLTDEKEARFE